MRRIALAAAIIVFAFAASFLLKQAIRATPESREAGNELAPRCNRLVSMSPGLTETLFALELGGQVVGVTRYCLYPPEAAQRAQVGGFLDPNYEVLVALEPDLVILTPFHREIWPELERLGLRYVIVGQDTVGDIRESFLQLGVLCGREARAKELVSDLDDGLAALTRRIGGRPPVRVLLATGRDVRSGALNEIYAVSTGSFLSDLLELAGGENCVTGKIAEYPALSAESILQLDPEVIIELGPEVSEDVEELAVNAWRVLPGLQAVQEGRVYYLGGAGYTIPGPRVLDTLVALAGCLHPDHEGELP